MSDQVLFQEGYVTVTTTMLKIGTAMYPIRNISSVQAAAILPSYSTAVMVLLFGLLCSACGVGIVGSFGSDTSAVFLGVGSVCVLLGVVLIATKKKIFSVRIATTGGQVDALTSTDFAAIHRVTQAVAQAVAQLR